METKVTIQDIISQVKSNWWTNQDIDFIVKKAQSEGKMIYWLDQFKQMDSTIKSKTLPNIWLTTPQAIWWIATALWWAAAAIGWAGLIAWWKQPEVLSPIKNIWWGMQTTSQLNKTQWLANKLTQVRDVGDLNSVREGSQIVAQNVKPWTSTYQDIYKQFGWIKEAHYNQPVDFKWVQTTMKWAMEKIPVPKNFSRAKSFVNGMLEDLTNAQGKVKLWQEELYKSLSTLKWKLNKWTANLWELNNDLKMNMNKFFKWWTEAWTSKSWLNPEWARNIYNEIKWFITTTAKKAWLTNVEAINQWYHSLLDTEWYIENMANKTLRETNKIIKPSIIEKAWEVVWKVANVALRKTWVLDIVKNTLWWIIWESNKTISALELEKQLPKILKALWKTVPEIKTVSKSILKWVWKLGKWVLSADPTWILSSIIENELYGKWLKWAQIQEFTDLKLQWKSAEEAAKEAKKVDPNKQWITIRA